MLFTLLQFGFQVNDYELKKSRVFYSSAQMVRPLSFIFTQNTRWTVNLNNSASHTTIETKLFFNLRLQLASLSVCLLNLFVKNALEMEDLDNISWNSRAKPLAKQT